MSCSQKNLKKKSKTIGVENDQEWMLYNLIHNVQLPQTRYGRTYTQPVHIIVVGGTQPKNPALGWDLDRRHVRFTKILPKKSKTIGAENDHEWMLYNMDP